MQPQVINNPVNATQPSWEHRLGLIPARIGASFAHKLGIAMPMAEPRYGTTPASKEPAVRTRIAPKRKFYEMGVNQLDGSKCETKALPGATVMLVVEDFSRLSVEEQEQVKWHCNHPDCAGARFDTKQELFESHEDNRQLIAQAKADPRGPKAHVYIGVLEVVGHEGSAAKRDAEGKVTKPAVPATETVVMLVSDEV